MAKKKKSTFRASLNGFILTIFGAAMLLLGMLPAISSTVDIGIVSSTTAYSFWNVLGDIFSNGFQDSLLIIQICTIVYLSVGIISTILGVLGLVKIINTEKTSVILYLLVFVALLVYMIVFLSDSSSLIIGGHTFAKSSTLVYIPLGVSALLTVYGIYKMLKN